MTMPDALVGHTGFVGSNVLRQRSFAQCFNSKNSAELSGREFGQLWFCGLPGAKWAINQDPEPDLRNIERLQGLLESVRCERFVLISTIDVLGDHGSYGRHRRDFEDWVRERFSNRVIVRLPGIFGPGLKKNVIFDLCRGQMLDRVHIDDAYQWYDLADLSDDVDLALDAGADELDLYTEPVENRALLRLFPDVEAQPQERAPRRYDHRSRQAGLFGRSDYVRDADTVLDRIGRFVSRS